MKSKLAIAFSFILVASGVAAASSFDSGFEDDSFFENGVSFDDPFFGDDSSEDDSSDSSPFDDDWFSDDFFSDDGENTDSSNTTEGCEEDEYHIPEDRDCDGEIDDEFQGDYPGNDTDTGTDNDTQEVNDSEGDLGVCVIGVDSPCNSEEYDGDNETGENDSSEDPGDDTGVTEQAYIQEVPEEGDPYFEAGTDDWVSYVNPRDDYNPAYDSRDEAPGSGKVCMTLLNENGEPIVGETVPDTQASMDLDGIEWHSSANPFTLEFPLTENYERPLDSDQFGTSSDLPQGDGYLDTHCLEYHQVPANHTLTYDQVEISGQNAEDIKVVGYYDQRGTWSSDFDPENDVSPYGSSSSSDGTASMVPGNSHNEVLVVLQLDR